MIRFHLDQHITRKIAAALRKRGIDVTTTVEAGLEGAEDSAHIAYALSNNRVIFTNDPDFLRLDAAGVPHAGIAFCHQGARTIGQIVQYLALMHECYTGEEMHSRVEYI
jgi:predicted nuclease of predicted toxin-antitoxin system